MFFCRVSVRVRRGNRVQSTEIVLWGHRIGDPFDALKELDDLLGLEGVTQFAPQTVSPSPIGDG